MIKLLGILLCIVGVCVGVYVGVWYMFIGGVVQMVNGFDPRSGVEIAFGALRVIFAAPVGFLCGAVAAFPGYFLAGQR